MTDNITNRMIDRKRRWGKWEYSVAGAIALVAGIGIGGPIYYHNSNKNNAIKIATTPLKTKVESLQKRNIVLDSTLKTTKTTVANLETEHKKDIERIERESGEKIKSLEGRVKSVYEDSLRAVYQTQFSKHPAEIRDFAYKFEKGNEGRIYFDIVPVSGKTLREIVQTVIPENYKERKELASAIPGFFDKYPSLARKNGLSSRLTDYVSIDGTPQANGVWNLVFVDKNEKEKIVQYYPGGD